MPRTGPRRPPITIRVSAPAKEHLRLRAREQFGGNMSKMLREFISYALENYPR